MSGASPTVPIIDIGALIANTSQREEVASQIGQACGQSGFFYITRHGVNEKVQMRLERLSRQFFAQDLATKLEIRMERGGRAWRGYFPVGAELTSGEPDIKEGIYFGSELDEHHPMVRAATPLHGRNLFPSTVPALRETVLEYMAAMTQLGHVLMTGIALSLGLDASYFADRYTADPLILFRIFNYPALEARDETQRWSVGEHTDYGVLTILKQDDAGGLQVKSGARWVDAPPVPGTFVCNIGDMLDRMTGGRYRSTAHRVRNLSGRARLSFPFFFDPNFAAAVRPIELGETAVHDDRDERWDRASVHEFQGTYGDYVLSKVSKVFPVLRRSVL